MKKRRRIIDFSLSPGFDFRIGICFICFWLIVFLVSWILKNLWTNFGFIYLFLINRVFLFFGDSLFLFVFDKSVNCFGLPSFVDVL
jgi:hypothetical protein